MTELNPIIYDIVPSVANTVFKRYRNFIEREDLKQELLKWAFSRADFINEQLSETDTDKLKHNEGRVAFQMKRAAERYARKEKAARSGYQLGDEAYYDTATLAQLLPFVIASVLDGTVLEQAQEMIRDGQPKGSSSPAEGGTLLAALIDIKKEYIKMEQEDQKVLVLRYHESCTLEQIAAILECSKSSADRRCNHALRELNNKLGGASPYK